MANLASRRPLRAHFQHALLELPTVRVFVARGTGLIGEAVDHRLGLERIFRFMAVVTRRRDVTASQLEARVFVARQGECGRLVPV